MQFLVVEMSAGQMLEDVQLSVLGKAPIEFFGALGGKSLSGEEIFKKVKKIYQRIGDAIK